MDNSLILTIPLNPIPETIFLGPKARQRERMLHDSHCDLSERPIGLQMLAIGNLIAEIRHDEASQGMLGHPLSKYLSASVRFPRVPDRLEDEQRAFQRAAPFRTSLDKWDDFERSIGAINGYLADQSGSFRTEEVRSIKDARGGQTIYPQIALALKHLKVIHDYLDKFRTDFPLISSVIISQLLSAMHPFKDGNGRTARILYNLLASQATGCEAFLPIKVLSSASLGGDIIKQRLATVQSKWEPLIDQFIAYYAVVFKYLPR